MDRSSNNQNNQINPSLLNNEKFIERQKMEAEIENDAKILFQHQKHSKIDNFSGYFEFLHNNYLTPVLYDGMLFPSATHAFQASRSSDERTRKAILNAESLLVVLKIAKRIEEPDNWKLRRLKVMEHIVRDKFRRSRELQEKLKATGNRDIVMTYDDENESNQYWGVVNNKGQNQLGRIIMRIRSDLRENQELLNWISFSFEFISDQDLLPEIKLDVFKEGNLPSSDLILEHPSISRIHAAIVCDKKLGAVLVDLRSKAGTKLDGDMISDNIPYRLKNGKKIKFGLSTRDYTVNIDVGKIKKLYEKEKKQLLTDLELINKLENPEINEELLKQSFGIENNDDNENIFVGNVPYNATDKAIKEIFEEFGTIKNIKIPCDWKTGQKKGHAFIQYEEPEMAKLAVKTGIIAYDEDKNKRVLDLSDRGHKPRCLKIRYAIPKPNWEKENKEKIEKGKEYEKNMIKDVEERIKKKRKRSASSSSSSSSDNSSSSSSSSSSSTEKIKKKRKHRKDSSSSEDESCKEKETKRKDKYKGKNRKRIEKKE